jgi:hypothetical protein
MVPKNALKDASRPYRLSETHGDQPEEMKELVIEAKTQLRGFYERLAKARRHRSKGGVERSPEGISSASLSKILGGDTSQDKKRPREEDGMTTPIAKRMNTVAKKSAPSRLSPQQPKAVTPTQSILRLNRETQQLPSPSPSPAKPCANTDHDPSIMEIVSNFPRHLLSNSPSYLLTGSPPSRNGEIQPRTIRRRI